MPVVVDKSYFIVIVLCCNEIHYIKLYPSKREAEVQAILLSNEWYNQDALIEFAANKIQTIKEMREYYHSKQYFNSGDEAHVVIEEITL